MSRLTGVNVEAVYLVFFFRSTTFAQVDGSDYAVEMMSPRRKEIILRYSETTCSGQSCDYKIVQVISVRASCRAAAASVKVKQGVSNGKSSESSRE